MARSVGRARWLSPDPHHSSLIYTVQAEASSYRVVTQERLDLALRGELLYTLEVGCGIVGVIACESGTHGAQRH